MTQPIRVFIGTDPSQLGAAEILKQTIIEKSSCPIQVETMEKLHIPQPRDARQSQRTGFFICSLGYSATVRIQRTGDLYRR